MLYNRVVLSIMALFVAITTICAKAEIEYTFLNKEKTNVQAKFILDASADDIWALLVDYDHAHEILPNIKEVNILENGHSKKVTQTVVKSGPFEVKYKSVVHEYKKNYYIKWEQTEGPFATFTGSWKLTPVNEHSTNVTYQIHMVHPLMPAALKNKLLKGSIPNMQNSLKRHLQP